MRPVSRRASDLFGQLVANEVTFWDDVYRRFLDRDLTRQDVRDLIVLGLRRTDGQYMQLLPLLRIGPVGDRRVYKRFMNFLAAHDLVIDYRPYRSLARSGNAIIEALEAQ